jgi:hypothetical protein
MTRPHPKILSWFGLRKFSHHSHFPPPVHAHDSWVPYHGYRQPSPAAQTPPKKPIKSQHSKNFSPSASLFFFFPLQIKKQQSRHDRHLALLHGDALPFLRPLLRYARKHALEKETFPDRKSPAKASGLVGGGCRQFRTSLADYGAFVVLVNPTVAISLKELSIANRPSSCARRRARIGLWPCAPSGW